MGGAERLVIDICNELSIRENISVALVVMNNINDFDLEINFPVLVTNSRVKLSVFKKNKYQLKSLINLLEEFKPDIIHSHLFEAEILSRALINENTRYFSHFHDNIVQLKRKSLKTISSKTSLTNSIERDWLIKRYKKSNSNLIAISKDTLSYIDSNIPKNKALNIFFLPNAINISRFKLENKQRFLQPSNTIKLISIGSLVSKKNQLFQIDVVQELISRGRDVILDICGDGNYRDVLLKKINKYHLQSNIRLLGKVKNIHENLYNSDLLIHTATYEPFGLVFLEAMAAKVPIVTLDGRGNTDITIDRFNSLVIKKESIDDFCDAVELLLDDNDFKTTLIQNASEFVKKYDIVSYVDRLLNIYETNQK